MKTKHQKGTKKDKLQGRNIGKGKEEKCPSTPEDSPSPVKQTPVPVVEPLKSPLLLEALLRELPFRRVKGWVAFCENCCYLSEDFNKCLRCKMVLLKSTKVVPTVVEPEFVLKPPKPPLSPEPLLKELPFRQVEGRLAVCGNCGFLSKDFNRCLRCRKVLPKSTKVVHTDDRKLKLKRLNEKKNAETVVEPLEPPLSPEPLLEELPFRQVEGKLAVCGNCGYISKDFSRCLRCRKVLPESTKVVPSIVKPDTLVEPFKPPLSPEPLQKELPFRQVEGKLAVCGNCGYLSKDFNRCLRCRKVLPESTKVVTSIVKPDTVVEPFKPPLSPEPLQKELPFRQVEGKLAVCGNCGYLSKDFSRCLRCRKVLPESTKVVPSIVKPDTVVEPFKPPLSPEPLQKELPFRQVEGKLAVCGNCGYLSKDFSRCLRCRKVLPESTKVVPSIVKPDTVVEPFKPPLSPEPLQKELPFRQVEGKLAVCGNCGYLSKDFNRCLRCRKVLPESTKVVTSIVKPDTVVEPFKPPLSPEPLQKELPFRQVEGKLAVCGNCGYLSKDFNRCLRCRKVLPESTKVVTSIVKPDTVVEPFKPPLSPEPLQKELPFRQVEGKLAVCGNCGYLSKDFNRCLRCRKVLPESTKVVTSIVKPDTVVEPFKPPLSPEPLQKELPFRQVEGKLTVCGNCGYLSKDFNKCLRCKMVLLKSTKVVPTVVEPEFVLKPPKPPLSPEPLLKELPFRQVEGRFAVCGNCGFLSKDFNRCLRCRKFLPKSTKVVHTDDRKSRRKLKLKRLIEKKNAETVVEPPLSPEPLLEELPFRQVEGKLAVCGNCGYLSKDFSRCLRCRKVLPESTKVVPSIVKPDTVVEPFKPPLSPEPLQKELPFRQVEGKLAVCGNCGYLSKDFNGCLRCRKVLPESTKVVTSIVKPDTVVEPFKPPLSPEPLQKELPFRQVEGKLAVCGNCGFLSKDFNRCLRCRKVLPKSTKVVHTDDRKSRRKWKLKRLIEKKNAETVVEPLEPPLSPEQLLEELPFRQVEGKLAVCGNCGYLSKDFSRCLRCRKVLPESTKVVTSIVKPDTVVEPFKPPLSPEPLQKELPFRQVEGKLAVCGNCGYLSKDFNRCLRCRKVLPESTNVVTSIVKPDTVVEPFKPPLSPEPLQKELPFRQVEGKLAVCGNCGFLSKDFNRCLRCRKVMPKSTKVVHTDDRKSRRKLKLKRLIEKKNAETVVEPLEPPLSPEQLLEELPFRQVEGKLAVCGNCGYLSKDFNRCLRCRKVMPQSTKVVTTDGRNGQKLKQLNEMKFELPKLNGTPKFDLLAKKERPVEQPKVLGCETVVISSDEDDDVPKS